MRGLGSDLCADIGKDQMQFVEGEMIEARGNEEEGGKDNITRVVNETSASFVIPPFPIFNPPSIFTECFH